MLLKIKEVRKRNKMTIEELSVKSGVSQRAISGYEANENDITLGKLQNIADALNVSIFELMDSDVKNVVNEPVVEYKKDPEWKAKYIELQERLLKSQEERIKILEEERQKYYGK